MSASPRKRTLGGASGSPFGCSFKVLLLAGIVCNSHGDKYTLYSLRHFYAVLSLRRGIGVFDVARNMGTSVQVIQNYYGKHATPRKLATQLGG
jgi:integrase